MELRSRQLPDTLSRPPFMAEQREQNELFDDVAFEPTPRSRSAPNAPTGLDTTNKVGFPPVPQLNQADLDEEARDFAGDRLFASIPQRGRDNPRQPEMPILRIKIPQRPMYEG
ncbi:hypothetical protein DPMN_153293 [Dreissena polymorpha]|uniref:Uncharacterized protein n=1 Tax=Dreissena polymorpha TaxID=45954 RepID=A0A9D4FKI9_DREPO|nr:hypothetical protein DPMN_153293 [Dreissena polymorpha]